MQVQDMTEMERDRQAMHMKKLSPELGITLNNLEGEEDVESRPPASCRNGTS